MGVRINKFVATAAIATLSTIIALEAKAQERPAPFQPRQSVPKAVDEAFFGDTDSFPYKNLSRPIEVLIGTPSFPENTLARDGEKIHRVYRDLLTQQVSSDPLIRTADLPNPYNMSILTMPTSSNRVMGSEFAIEQQPQFTPAPQPVAEPQLPQRF
jgi:hypothetical protein